MLSLTCRGLYRGRLTTDKSTMEVKLPGFTSERRTLPSGFLTVAALNMRQTVAEAITALRIGEMLRLLES